VYLLVNLLLEISVFREADLWDLKRCYSENGGDKILEKKYGKKLTYTLSFVLSLKGATSEFPKVRTRDHPLTTCKFSF